MGNRFKRGILEGSIASEEELKTAYKSEAKRTHPDLADSDGHEEFLRLRTEYEQARRELFRNAPRQATDSTEAERRAAFAPDDDPLVALEILLKRGFPKRPRHDKERLRYAYAKLRARSALVRIERSLPPLLDAMEEESIAEARKAATARVVRLLEDYLKARRTNSAALLAAFKMEALRTFPPVALGATAGDEDSGTAGRPGPAAAAFFQSLVGSIGP